MNPKDYDKLPYLFQFQYGAIKSISVDVITSPVAPFQFQYGAIKRCIFYLVFLLQASFNSNMVRLKERQKIMEMINKYGFQFQYGAIKRSLIFPAIRMPTGFNSNMVRLKVIAVYLYLCVIFMFQFQYGAIKRFS